MADEKVDEYAQATIKWWRENIKPAVEQVVEETSLSRGEVIHLMALDALNKIGTYTSETMNIVRQQSDDVDRMWDQIHGDEDWQD